jgi:hypothetical protein
VNLSLLLASRILLFVRCPSVTVDLPSLPHSRGIKKRRRIPSMSCNYGNLISRRLDSDRTATAHCLEDLQRKRPHVQHHLHFRPLRTGTTRTSSSELHLVAQSTCRRRPPLQDAAASLIGLRPVAAPTLICVAGRSPLRARLGGPSPRRSAAGSPLRARLGG